MMHVVATAGHVDHGKSTLVRALTGMEPDRWAEERRRGMTIDLGFAWTTLPSGDGVAFVDVPGHERFLTNMLAGVGPAPAVLFVVAADEGWMPQSQEHLDAIDALGVRHGLLVVTRGDLADPGPAVASALERISRTSLGRVESVAVSAVEGTGLERLRRALDDMAAGLPPAVTDAPVRLWIDRVFTVRGSGTVATGTLTAGTIRTGDQLELAPTGRRVQVRGLQTLKQRVSEATAVSRVAVNLRGVEHSDVRRGMALITAGGWTATHQVDVRFELPAGEESSYTDMPAESLVHIGTTRVQAVIRILSPVWPEEPVARLTLRAPLPLHVGDRLLLRLGDAGHADRRIVGATVLDVRPPALTRRGAAARRAKTVSALQNPGDGAFHLRQHGVLPVSAFAAMGCVLPSVNPIGGWLVDPGHWTRLGGRLRGLVEKHAADDPVQPGLPIETARRLLELPDRKLVEALITAPMRAEQGRVYPAAPTYALPEPLARAVARLTEDLRDRPYQAPTADRLAALGLDRKALGAAVRAGALLKIADGVVLLPGADLAAARLLSRAPQPFTASDARQALDSTRRVVIPLLEHLERIRLTERVGDTGHRCRSAPDAAA